MNGVIFSTRYVQGRRIKEGMRISRILFFCFRFIFKCLPECMAVHQMHAVPTEARGVYQLPQGPLFTTACNSSPRQPNTCMMYRHTCRQNTHSHRIKMKG